MGIYFILKGNEITTTSDILEWGKFMEGQERLIKQERLKIKDKKYFVSTVFLGLDHGFSFLETSSKPVLFETMIFPEDDNKEEWEEYQTRCCTKEEALKQHQEAIEWLENHKPL